MSQELGRKRHEQMLYEWPFGQFHRSLFRWLNLNLSINGQNSRSDWFKMILLRIHVIEYAKVGVWYTDLTLTRMARNWSVGSSFLEKGNQKTLNITRSNLNSTIIFELKPWKLFKQAKMTQNWQYMSIFQGHAPTIANLHHPTVKFWVQKVS